MVLGIGFVGNCTGYLKYYQMYGFADPSIVGVFYMQGGAIVLWIFSEIIYQIWLKKGSRKVLNKTSLPSLTVEQYKEMIESGRKLLLLDN